MENDCCQECGSYNILYDDYGVIICEECYFKNKSYYDSIFQNGYKNSGDYDIDQIHGIGE